MIGGTTKDGPKRCVTTARAYHRKGPDGYNGF
jgi:hypothetical protein